MKFAKWTAIAITALALAISAIAQDNPKPKHHQYKLYEVGTFGGPSSYTSINVVSLTPAGTIGTADTTLPDPFAPNCYNSPDCYVKHAFQWRNGVLADLGALPGNHGGNSSYAYVINSQGLVAGISENGSVDRATGAPESDAVVWINGHIMNLGTFGGTQSAAEEENARGQVVGVSTNAVPDPFSFGGDPFPATTQSRAFLWDKGHMQDLGTLGGPDAFARYINASGQVAGWSYTSYTPNPDSGVPTIDPFLWDKGRMIDLGTLGGTHGQPQWINNRGQVVGWSNVAGDGSYHGFLWDKGSLTDLGTSGGDYSFAEWINEAGDISGETTLPGNTNVPAIVWSHGKVTILGNLPGYNLSNAKSINASRQVVGFSCELPCADQLTYDAFLWEDSGPMVEMDSLVKNLSNLHIYWGTYIGDDGRIVAQAADPSGSTHDLVLVPDGDCGNACQQRITEREQARLATGGANPNGAPVDGAQLLHILRDMSGRQLPITR